jgi:hypothetical protein
MVMRATSVHQVPSREEQSRLVIATFEGRYQHRKKVNLSEFDCTKQVDAYCRVFETARREGFESNAATENSVSLS